MSKQRVGIMKVSTGLLAEWMQFPPSVRVVGVSQCRPSEFGYFEVLIEGDLLPETDEGEQVPRVACTVTKTALEHRFDIVRSQEETERLL